MQRSTRLFGRTRTHPGAVNQYLLVVLLTVVLVRYCIRIPYPSPNLLSRCAATCRRSPNAKSAATRSPARTRRISVQIRRFKSASAYAYAYAPASTSRTLGTLSLHTCLQAYMPSKCSSRGACAHVPPDSALPLTTRALQLQLTKRCLLLLCVGDCAQISRCSG